LKLIGIAASPLEHDSACASNNNGEWIDLLPYSRALFWTAQTHRKSFIGMSHSGQTPL
jgi:hypothetical protein